jgi:hypothetical protein
MTSNSQAIFVGDTLCKHPERTVRGETVAFNSEPFYKIEAFDLMDPFFMSIVSSSDHWLYVASTGGLSAGRVSADQALFPYYTSDKLTESSDHTGPKTILLVSRAGRTSCWEPLSERQRGHYTVARSLYKNVPGTTLVFEECNLDLGLTFRYAWRTGETFGFVKSTTLINTQPSGCRVAVLDGLQNILPANVAMSAQQTFSVLLDAYKRSELHRESGLAIFALNSTLTDLAEPSESLLATTVAQVGLAPAGYLLSSGQLDRFRSGQGLETENEVRGQRGAYFALADLDLGPQEVRTWHLIADVQQDSAAIAEKLRWLKREPAALARDLEADMAANRLNLWKIVAGADGIQLSGHPSNSAAHFANTLFNVMRGGVPVDQYRIQTSDFVPWLSACNRPEVQAHSDFLAALPPSLSLTDLPTRLRATGSADLIRLSHAYMPLTLSRRHGDPSRPWNRFAINLKKPDGSLKLDYEGNWRDIFQNWEALAYSYPEAVENMVCTFLNATTVDGYNPYRVTYHGVDWEKPQPGNPWANFGYWSDHQIVYLQKLLEISAKVHPGKLSALLARPLFSYANVPYRLKPYADLLTDPYNTIDFDRDQQKVVDARRRERGADGKLVADSGGQVLHVTLAEKLLTLLLAKLVNFVPEGGIWMNTQRPEWNDANNALVGKGLSVVTLGYLLRFIAFCRDLFTGSGLEGTPLNAEVQSLLHRMFEILVRFQALLHGSFNDEQRRDMMDALGQAGSDYRWIFYRNGLAGRTVDSPVAEIVAFLALAQRYVEHSLRANRRGDNLYHAYNILRIQPGHAAIGRLYEMLEGQVSILSSGLLSGDESVALLQSLRASALYEPTQNSYLLYPDRSLPSFLERNCLTEAQVQAVPLLVRLVKAGDTSVLVPDLNGVYHFNGKFRNSRDVGRALEGLKVQGKYADFVEADFEAVSVLFEETFHHDEFTGRSSTFFAYEGLGSVYWHMVAKLLLAAQETALRFKHEPCARALIERYRDIRAGLSFNKTPEAYGAFPTDPYSHTPKGQGAKQPGMTGSVKELILTRLAETGLTFEAGRLVFDGLLLDPTELVAGPSRFSYLDVDARQQTLELLAGSLAYTICQTPVVVVAGTQPGVTVHMSNGARHHLDGNSLDEDTSRRIFERDGAVHHLVVSMTLPVPAHDNPLASPSGA